MNLIASTTENPYFAIYNAVLSRSTVFEFKPVEPEEISQAVTRAFTIAAGDVSAVPEVPGVVTEYICLSCGGDVRKAMNAVELTVLAAENRSGHLKVTLEDAKQVSQRSSMRYDRSGDAHYDILSAFHKSVRGSDANAALHYLARLLEAGDLLSPCRRLLVIAAEDIGLAYPMAMPIVKACVDSARELGLPEGRIPLAEAVILLCNAPKSDSAISAIDAAAEDVRQGHTGDIPKNIKDAHYAGAGKLGRGLGYLYPHAYTRHFVSQQYLPDDLKDARYYEYGDNKTEQAAKAYWDAVRRGQ